MVKKVLTPVFRVSFPSVFEASSFEDGPPKFGLTAVFEPSKFSESDKKAWAEMKALADEVSLEKFKRKVDQLPSNFKRPLRDGAEKADLEGFGEGKMFCSITSKMRPGVIDLQRTPILDASDFYPGCYARATITAYAYDNKGKGVAFGLQNIQKIKDGDRLDGRTDAADDFADAGIDDRWVDGENDPLA